MPEVAFIFPGQGSQKVGMGRDLFDRFESVRSAFATASEILGWDLAKACFEGSAEDLTETTVAQPALLTIGVACCDLVRTRGIDCIVTAGHSLGEYSALVAAEALNFRDAVVLVKERARLMREAPPGGMAAVLGMDRRQVEALCREAGERGMVQPANFNAPGQIVISGEKPAVDFACQLAKERGALRVVTLQVSGGFHSSLMREAGERLAEILETVAFTTARCPVISNATGQAVTSPKEIREALKKQMVSSVLWEDSVRALRGLGATTVVELGPGTVLCGLVRRIDKGLQALHVEDNESLESTVTTVKERRNGAA